MSDFHIIDAPHTDRRVVFATKHVTDAFRESQKSWSQHSKSGNGSFKCDPKLMQREWGAPAPSFSHTSYCESEVRTSLTRHKLCVRRPVERDMKRNENGVFTFFFSFFFNQARHLGLWANWIGRFIPQLEKKKKTASPGNSFPLWEIYDCISVSVSGRAASSAHLGHVSHSPLWQMSSARRVSGLRCCTSSSARSTSALRPRTLRLNVMHGACRKKKCFITLGYKVFPSHQEPAGSVPAGRS